VKANRRIPPEIILAIHRQPHPRRGCKKSDDEDEDENSVYPSESRTVSSCTRRRPSKLELRDEMVQLMVETQVNSFACEKNHKFELAGFWDGG
jgi:hypothetical protein